MAKRKVAAAPDPAPRGTKAPPSGEAAPKQAATKAAPRPRGRPPKGSRRKPEPVEDEEEPVDEAPAVVEQRPPEDAKPAKRQRRAKAGEAQVLQSVHHPSHRKLPGDVFVLGDGDCGQLGKGEDVAEALRPAYSPVGGQQVLQVAAGGMHSVALTAACEVWTTGVNDEGALGRRTAGELWEKAEDAGDTEVGDAYTWGRVNIPAEHGKVVQVSAGDSHTAALTELGAVWAWGTFRDASGVFGFSPQERIALAPRVVHAPATPHDQILKIASGADHVCALTAGGTLLSWGCGQQGQLGRVGTRLREGHASKILLMPQPVPLHRRARGSGAPHIEDFACGTYCTAALARGGRVWAWGLNNYGQLGLPGQGLVWAPAHVAALDSFACVEVRPGQHHTLARDGDGRVLALGRPTYGRLGRPGVNCTSDDAVPEPGLVAGLDGECATALAAGLAVSGCVTNSGHAYLWGFGTNSQLGKGDDDSDEPHPRRLQPTKRIAGLRATQLEFGGQHALLLMVPGSSDTLGGAPSAPGVAAAPAQGGPAPAQMENGVAEGHASGPAAGSGGPAGLVEDSGDDNGVRGGAAGAAGEGVAGKGEDIGAAEDGEDDVEQVGVPMAVG